MEYLELPPNQGLNFPYFIKLAELKFNIANKDERGSPNNGLSLSRFLSSKIGGRRCYEESKRLSKGIIGIH